MLSICSHRQSGWAIGEEEFQIGRHCEGYVLINEGDKKVKYFPY